jgi:GT2 family glycosyltransferase
MKDVAVVIVTHNSVRFLDGCLGSIAGAVPGIEATVTVVDNESTDGTVAAVRRILPEADVVASGSNAGFAAANNIALRRTTSRHVLLLNPDTVLRPEAVTRLVRFLDGRAEYWAAGPAVLNGDGSLQRTGVSFPSLWNILVEALFLDRAFPRSRLFGGHRRLFDDPGRVQDVDYVQGSCLLVNRAAVERVGPLDEEYFMYFEETDWCYRIRCAGGRVARVPDAEVIHFGGEDSAHYGESRLMSYHGGLLRFFRKHRSKTSGIVLRIVLLGRSILRVLVWSGAAMLHADRRRDARSSVRGYLRGIALIVREPL